MPAPESSSQAFFTYDENTMSAQVSTSVAVYLQALQQIYPVSIAEYQSQCTEFEKYVEHQLDGDPELKVAFEFLKTQLTEGQNQLDYVTIWSDDAEQEAKYLTFDLRFVFSAVFRALSDLSQYPAADRYAVHFRLETLCNVIKSINRESIPEQPVCHMGIRHALFFTLNGVFPDPFCETFETTKAKPMMIVEHLDDYFLQTADAFVSRKLSELYLDDAKRFYQILIVWLTSDEMPAELLALVGGQMLGQELRQACVKHGMSVEGGEIKNKLVGWVQDDVVRHLDLELVDFPFWKYAKAIMRIQSSSPSVLYNKALERVRSDIITVLENPDLHDLRLFTEQLKLFMSLEECFVLLARAESYLSTNLYIEVDRVLLAYYQQVASDDAMPATNEHADLLGAFICEMDACRKGGDIAWLGEFIQRYYSKRAGNSKDVLYRKLLLLHYDGKIVCQDSWLQRLKPSGFSFTSPPLGNSYVINRVILHAVLIHPERWSSLFFETFMQVITVVSESKYKDQYPRGLLQQLCYLKRNHHPAGGVLFEPGRLTDGEQPYIPMLDFPDNMRDLCFIVRSHSDEHLPDFFERNYRLIAKLITTPGKLNLLVRDLRNTQIVGFSEQLKQLYIDTACGPDNFEYLVVGCSIEKMLTICNLMFPLLVPKFASISSFSEFVAKLPGRAVEMLCANMSEQRPDFISDELSCVTFLKAIPSDTLLPLYFYLTPIIKHAVTGLSSLAVLLAFLPEELKTQTLALFQANFSEWFTTEENFATILPLLPSDACQSLVLQMGSEFVARVGDENMDRLLQSLPDVQRTMVQRCYASIKRKRGCDDSRNQRSENVGLFKLGCPAKIVLPAVRSAEFN